jgi:hypothetical protein
MGYGSVKYYIKELDGVAVLDAYVWPVRSAQGSFTITVSSPNGGETWPLASSQAIQWTSSGVSGNVKIELSRNGGTTWTTLISSTPNDGTHPWTVTAPVTTQARLRVSSVSNPAISDTSAAHFQDR